MKIAYISRIFPYTTQTFVSREYLGLKARGLQLIPFAFKKPSESDIHKDYRGLVDETVYFPHLLSFSFLLNVLIVSVLNPVKTAMTFIEIFREVKQCSGGFAGLTRDFVRGIYLVSEVKKRKNISHLHSTFSTEQMTSIYVAAKILGMSYSFTDHSSFRAFMLGRKIINSLFCVVISHFIKSHLFKPHISKDDASKVEVVYCGIDTTEWAAGGNNIPETIVSVGSLGKTKGHDFLIKACVLLLEEGIDFRCHIVGEGSEKPNLDALISKFGLTDRVILKGKKDISEVRSLVESCSVFVLACVETKEGDIDGIPVSLMEAMALSKPVISTNISGIPELIESGVDGILTEQKNPSSLAEAIKTILNDREYAAGLGKKARLKIETKFNINKNMDQLADIFKKYLNR